MSSENELIPTRLSLLSRLKDCGDNDSWRDFFETYWKLIYRTAIKAGLNREEAQDVVQEVMVSVMKSMPGFKYDREKGSFKNWLRNLTDWRINDFMRKNARQVRLPLPARKPEKTSAETSVFSARDQAADPDHVIAEPVWDEDWAENLLEAAIQRVKRKVEPKQFQAFDLCVAKQWPVAKVAQTLKISPGWIYLNKHRISNMIKKEVSRLQNKLI